MITDRRILNAISNRYDITFDSKFKYVKTCSDEIDFKGLTYKGQIYKLKYVPGCFYPFLYKV